MASVVGKLIPVRVTNSADHAAPGEHVAGAGKECQDIIMVTLDADVGDGIIINGRIFEGSEVTVSADDPAEAETIAAMQKLFEENL